MTPQRTTQPRQVDPATLIKVECANAPLLGSERYHEPRRWVILTTQAAIDHAESLGRPCTVPTYQKDGRKTTWMLANMRPGLREAWERKHGHGLVHLNFIHNARTADLYGCCCSQCTSPEIAAEYEAATVGA